MTYSQVVIIIPTFNERDNIRQLIVDIKKELPRITIIVVDDQSPDNTAVVVKKLQKKYSNLFLINNQNKSGRGKAVIVGLKKAFAQKKFKVFVEMDADFSHQPSELARLIKIVTSSEKIVAVGSRYITGGKTLNWPTHRIFFSFLTNHLLRFILGFKLTDYTNGFRAYPKTAVAEILQHPLVTTSYLTLSEVALILHRADFKFVEVPCVFPNRVRGKSNTTICELWNNIQDLIQIKKRYRR